VKETVTLNAGTELIEVFDGGPLSNLPVNYHLGNRVFDYRQHGSTPARKMGLRWSRQPRRVEAG